MKKPTPQRSSGATRIDEDQLRLIRQCILAGDATEWNEWRRLNPDVEIWLQGATLRPSPEGRPGLRGVNLEAAHLDRIDLSQTVLVRANLRGASMVGAHLPGAILVDADLSGGELREADLRGANLRGADLRGAGLSFAKVDGETLVVTSLVDRSTDFTGVALDGARVDPGLKQLLQYSIRRKRWGHWYREHRVLAGPVGLFWLVCDYGHSTWRILVSFALLTLIFAAAYTVFPQCVAVNSVDYQGPLLDFGHALYFSIVTMTTLGFGDVYANPHSHLGQFFLCCQVVLGYVLLGALVTRLAVLFTAGGPAAAFSRAQDERPPRPPAPVETEGKKPGE